MSDDSVNNLQDLLSRVRERRTERPVATTLAAMAVEPIPAAPAAPMDLEAPASVATESDAPDVPTLPPLALESEPPSEPPPAARADAEVSFGDLASSAPPAVAKRPEPESPLAGAMQRLTSPDLDAPTNEPPAPASESAPAPAPESAPEPEPVQARADAPSLKIAHEVPQATGPVAVEEGERPAREVMSFEDLIARSLSLRARG